MKAANDRVKSIVPSSSMRPCPVVAMALPSGRTLHRAEAERDGLAAGPAPGPVKLAGHGNVAYGTLRRWIGVSFREVLVPS